MRRYRWGNQYELKRFIFLAVRDALYAPARPDSKRQERRRQRDLARHGARIMKASGEVLPLPVKSTNARKVLRREMREARERRREETRKEQLRMARAVADRLMGRRRHAA